jgi:hypothetical protein
MSRETASKGSRRVAGREYPFFYNPMWGHFGDMNEGSPGTYYYSGSRHKEFFWHIFDQILIRPALIEFFQHDSLKILSTDDNVSFLTTQGLPNKSIASDHLPILFKLNL